MKIQPGDQVILWNGTAYTANSDNINMVNTRRVKAFSRHPPVKEVKRIARAGEYVKITYTSGELSHGCYKIGDIFKAEPRFADSGRGVVAVKTDKAMFTTPNLSLVDSCEYVVLENYYEKT